MSLSRSRKVRSEFFLAVVSILVFTWFITVVPSSGQHTTDSAARPERGNIKGTVISADEKEVTVKSDDEGKVIVVKVPMRQRPGGKWALDENIARFTASLKQGEKVDVDYGTHGEYYFIRFIKRATETSGVFQHESNLVTGWVISGTEDDVTIEMMETGKVIVLRVPMRRREDGKRVKVADLARMAEKLQRGQLIFAKYSRGDEGVYFLRNVKPISFSRSDGGERAQLIAKMESLEHRLAQIEKALRELLGKERAQTHRPREGGINSER